ncbi:MAG: hypothetical protein HYS06_09175 [Methylocystis sp.]|nr:hypothetical protein [Methylocystis sp.]
MSQAHAHCFVGSRFFPATLAIDDPCVADELSLPTVSVLKNGDDPPAREVEISGEFSKRITDKFGVSVESAFTRLRVPGGPSFQGFQNLETTFKYQFLTEPAAEFVASAALSVEWGHTGNPSVGAEKFHVLTPIIFFGKGLGDLPKELSFLRPIAVTGTFGYAVPTWSRIVTTSVDVDEDEVKVEFEEERIPNFLVYGATVQYSMPYLNAQVVDLGLPKFINQLIPIVEAKFQTPVANVLTSGTKTTGTVNPGVIWIGSSFQLAAEAIVPVNRASGKAVGWMVQVHFYLDDMFPTTIGRPILAGLTSEGGK